MRLFRRLIRCSPAAFQTDGSSYMFIHHLCNPEFVVEQIRGCTPMSAGLNVFVPDSYGGAEVVRSKRLTGLKQPGDQKRLRHVPRYYNRLNHVIKF